jgi:hypothetical protein
MAPLVGWWLVGWWVADVLEVALGLVGVQRRIVFGGEIGAREIDRRERLEVQIGLAGMGLATGEQA